MSTKYHKVIDDICELEITEDNFATISADDLSPVTVQLASDAEATQMIREFEDTDGDIMWDEGAIFGKYPELHKFRP